MSPSDYHMFTGMKQKLEASTSLHVSASCFSDVPNTASPESLHIEMCHCYTWSLQEGLEEPLLTGGGRLSAQVAGVYPRVVTSFWGNVN